MTFDEIHERGAEKYGAAWLIANRKAIAAATHCGFDPSDPKVKHLLSLVVLRSLEAALAEPKKSP